MAVIKAVSSKSSIGTAINYITKDEKTEEKLISGINCTPVTAIDEMKATKELWNKTSGRQYKHFVQSFSPNEKITPEKAHRIALELSQERFKQYEVIIATHKDKEHIHSHIIVNSVSFENGKKIQQSKADLQLMKNHSDKICRDQGLSICEKGQEISTYDIGKYKSLEKATQGSYKSYVFDTAMAVLNAKEQATSRDNFIKLMKQQGYETNWSDKRKYITFRDKDGNKVRNNNLEKTFKGEFGKEQLESEFDRNTQRKTYTINSERTASRIKPSETARIGEQSAQRSINDVERTMRGITERVKNLTSDGRAEQKARKRATAERVARSKERELEDYRKIEQQRNQLEESKRITERKYKNPDRGFDFER